MKDDEIEALRKRVADRRAAASRKLKDTLGGRVSVGRHQVPPGNTSHFDQTTMQAASAILYEGAETDLIGAATQFGADAEAVPGRPAAPTGRWRCIVSSDVVSIDLVASISEGGALSGQGSLVYVATNRIYEVTGQGDWTALPPDPGSENWLFKFRLQPSNHAIFSWFASPTQSPRHLHNRFVLPDNRGVVETNCEQIG